MVVDNLFMFDGLGSITDIARHEFEENYYTVIITQIRTPCYEVNVRVVVAVAYQQRV